MGGGGLPMPECFGPFFHQVKVPKIGTFLLNSQLHFGHIGPCSPALGVERVRVQGLHPNAPCVAKNGPTVIYEEVSRHCPGHAKQQLVTPPTLKLSA